MRQKKEEEEEEEEEAILSVARGVTGSNTPPTTPCILKTHPSEKFSVSCASEPQRLGGGHRFTRLELGALIYL